MGLTFVTQHLQKSQIELLSYIMDYMYIQVCLARVLIPMNLYFSICNVPGIHHRRIICTILQTSIKAKQKLE